jgi:ABC-type transporter Mla MlaB component
MTQKKVASRAKSKTAQAKKKTTKTSLIGIDPLAWMGEEKDTLAGDEGQVIEQESMAAEVAEPATEIETTDNNESDCSEVVVELGSALGMREVEAVFEQLKAVSEDQPVIFNAPELERVDAAGLQLLAAYCQQASALGNAPQWRQSSESLCRAAELVDLSSAMNL